LRTQPPCGAALTRTCPWVAEENWERAHERLREFHIGLFLSATTACVCFWAGYGYSLYQCVLGRERWPHAQCGAALAASALSASLLRSRFAGHWALQPALALPLLSGCLQQQLHGLPAGALCLWHVCPQPPGEPVRLAARLALGALQAACCCCSDRTHPKKAAAAAVAALAVVCTRSDSVGATSFAAALFAADMRRLRWELTLTGSSGASASKLEARLSTPPVLLLLLTTLACLNLAGDTPLKGWRPGTRQNIFCSL
jgi:hypothetical protein